MPSVRTYEKNNDQKREIIFKKTRKKKHLIRQRQLFVLIRYESKPK